MHASYETCIARVTLTRRLSAARTKYKLNPIELNELQLFASKPVHHILPKCLASLTCTIIVFSGTAVGLM